MIRNAAPTSRSNAIDFALNNRFMVVALALLLRSGARFRFTTCRSKPIRTSPTTTSRSLRSGRGAPRKRSNSKSRFRIEMQMNGMPHLAHLRSSSLFGLST